MEDQMNDAFESDFIRMWQSTKHTIQCVFPCVYEF